MNIGISDPYSLLLQPGRSMGVSGGGSWPHLPTMVQDITFPEAARLWGSGRANALFGQHLKVPTPWPRLPALKSGPKTPSAAHVFETAPSLAVVDPRTVWCSQPWVLRHHVEYYLTGEWEATGRISADQAAIANRYPLVVPDTQGRLVILAGHHRAAAALLKAQPLLVRCMLTAGRPRAVVPHLWIAEGGEPARSCVPVALEAIRGGEISVVEDADIAQHVLERLGLDRAEVADRLLTAGLPSAVSGS